MLVDFIKKKKPILFLLGSSFSLGFLFINFFNYLLSDEKIASLISLFFLFFYSIIASSLVFKVKEKKILIIKFIFMSLGFRGFEYFLFNYFLFFTTNMNLKWGLALSITALIKIFLIPKIINYKNDKLF